MRRFAVPDVDTFISAIQDEISKTTESRYFHRLHVILHVLQGYSTYDASRVYGHSPRTIQYWIQRLLSHGLAGLWDREHPGRPPQLSHSNEQRLRNELRRSPRELGYEQNLWDGPLLSYHVKEYYGAALSVRQCQRLFHKLGFKTQRPRRQPHEAAPLRQEVFKKIPPMDERSTYATMCRRRGSFSEKHLLNADVGFQGPITSDNLYLNPPEDRIL